MAIEAERIRAAAAAAAAGSPKPLRIAQAAVIGWSAQGRRYHSARPKALPCGAPPKAPLAGILLPAAITAIAVAEVAVTSHKVTRKGAVGQVAGIPKAAGGGSGRNFLILV